MNDIHQDIKEIKSALKEQTAVLNSLAVDSRVNTANLASHMRRTELNEARIQKLEYLILGTLLSGLLGLLVKYIFFN